jgi:hypothetical protein
MPFVKGQPGGPGRRPKAQTFARSIARAEKRIAASLPALIDNMLTLASGVLVEETDPVTQKTQVYRKPPDRQANEYLINRILGKPTERNDVTITDAWIFDPTETTDPPPTNGAAAPVLDE